MSALAAGLLLVPLLDQALKLLVLRRLGSASVSLGPLGRLQVVQARIWWARPQYRPTLPALWGMWSFAAAVLAVLTVFFPWAGWFTGALLGGSFSHALEFSLRGSICDYVCLRFWPAFNLADVAITAGAIGVVVGAFITIKP